MEIEQLGYALAPTPGMPLGVRKQQLETSRFIDIRNLAAHLYKKSGPNGQLVPLMTYNETLDNRDLVRKTILIHEMSCTHQGNPLVVNDGTNLDAPPTAAQQPPNGVQNGTQMQPPVPQPQYAAPQPPVGPAAAGAAPMQQYAPPPQQFAPPPPQQQFAPPPQQMAPAPADPAAAAAAPAPGGRKRRGGGGAAVAPPPAAPPPAAAPPQQFAPPQAPPGAFAAAAPPPAMPNGQWTPPQGQAPAPSWQPPTQAAPPPPQAAAPAPGVDLSPVFTKLDDLGRGVTYATKIGDELKVQFNQIMVALHHLYLSNPATGQATGGKANTLPEFQQFLNQYLPK